MGNKGGFNLKKLFEKSDGKDKYTKIIIFLGLAGILLIFLSGLFKGEPQKATETKKAPVITADQYAEQLQQNLSQIVSSIQGAGSSKILVTMEKNTEYVYAMQEKRNTQTQEDNTNSSTVKKQDTDNTETSYILVKDSDGSQKALPVTEVQPTVKGVVVVCQGGDNPEVQQNVINAVTTALNISSKRVCVIKSST